MLAALEHVSHGTGADSVEHRGHRLPSAHRPRGVPVMRLAGRGRLSELIGETVRIDGADGR
ncbi:hypothetical protein ACFZCY_43460 [Streptomyces sp. NPDC007983]|uniref:hypothetical protein n=1 Tax=Streptomyces sp. NPDC007983 TaxID=3364800 RepID=UPI0036EE5A77